MNGVAREFWAEVYDLAAPIEDRRDRPVRSRHAKARKLVLTRRPNQRPIR
jgi:hypothetical protein